MIGQSVLSLWNVHNLNQHRLQLRYMRTLQSCLGQPFSLSFTVTLLCTAYRCHKTARVICFVSCCWLCWWRECTPACVRTRVCVCVFVSDVHGSRTMPIVLTIVTAFCCASAIWTRYKKQSEVPIVTFVFDMSGTLYSEDTYFRLKNKESICKRNWPVKVKPSVRMHMMVVEL